MLLNLMNKLVGSQKQGITRFAWLYLFCLAASHLKTEIKVTAYFYETINLPWTVRHATCFIASRTASPQFRRPISPFYDDRSRRMND
jgi:hypothetical protein